MVRSLFIAIVCSAAMWSNALLLFVARCGVILGVVGSMMMRVIIIVGQVMVVVEEVMVVVVEGGTNMMWVVVVGVISGGLRM